MERNLQKLFRRPIFRRRGVRTAVVALAVLLSAWLFMLAVIPRPLFDDPCSTLLFSRGGELLGARIAADGQWRFPESDSLPDKFVKCLVAFEDKRFFAHPGVDPAALARALAQNVRSRGVVSGGSTLTMQLARIARGNRPRTVWQKTVESLWALHLETTYSKRRILSLYASNAPFGGNVVGLEAAAWRWFGRGPFELSWAESATLAVLPNSPALIHPGRNRRALQSKRDGLLLKLAERGVIDRLEYELACMEPIPEAPSALPDLAPHLLERLAAERRGERITSSLDASLQRAVQSVVDRYGREYASNRVYNLAAVAADVETGEVLAYAGNVSYPMESSRGGSVDIITSPRSTGSVLKPLLYAGMLHDGLILPSTLVADTPLNIGGFSPQNYNKTYHGAVPAHSAIERSLNVPLVRMLSQYNTGRFISLLKGWGMTTLCFPEDHYGASIILGGAEGTLWDIAGMYASMARTLNHFGRYSGRYDSGDIHPLTPCPAPAREPVRSAADDRLHDRPLLSAASIWSAFEAMSALNRPEEEAEWQHFASMKRVAWKTGTSYGSRDAWSVGVTPRYVVGVWVGNASGEGRAGLTGVGSAAPVMFDIFSGLSASGWFETPWDELEAVAVCPLSGYRASDICRTADTLYVPASGAATATCPYHRLVHLSSDGRYRVNSSCEEPSRMVTVPWFVLPPSQEYYYRHHNSGYAPLPPLKPGCAGTSRERFEIIYPEPGAVLFRPRGISGERERFVFSAAHSDRGAVVYWHIDDRYIGSTEGTHRISCAPGPGRHILTLTDSGGDQRRIYFDVRE